MARPCKLTPKVQEQVCRAIADGNTRECAAELAGVGARSLFRWLAQGKAQGKGRFRQLWQAVQKAEAEAESHCVKVVRKAMPKSWQAAAWWLERRRKRRYGKAHSVEVKGDRSKPVQVETKATVDVGDQLAPYLDLFGRLAIEDLSRNSPEQPVPAPQAGSAGRPADEQAGGVLGPP